MSEKELTEFDGQPVTWEASAGEGAVSFYRVSDPPGDICLSCIVKDVGEDGLKLLQEARQSSFPPVNKDLWPGDDLIEYSHDATTDQGTLNCNAEEDFGKGDTESCHTCEDCSTVLIRAFITVEQ